MGNCIVSTQFKPGDRVEGKSKDTTTATGEIVRVSDCGYFYEMLWTHEGASQEIQGKLYDAQTIECFYRKISAAKKLVELTPSKECVCGKKHFCVPYYANYMEDGDLSGWYWECSCKSTLFIPKGIL